MKKEEKRKEAECVSQFMSQFGAEAEAGAAAGEGEGVNIDKRDLQGN